MSHAPTSHSRFRHGGDVGTVAGSLGRSLQPSLRDTPDAQSPQSSLHSHVPFNRKEAIQHHQARIRCVYICMYIYKYRKNHNTYVKNQSNLSHQRKYKYMKKQQPVKDKILKKPRYVCKEPTNQTSPNRSNTAVTSTADAKPRAPSVTHPSARSRSCQSSQPGCAPGEDQRSHAT